MAGKKESTEDFKKRIEKAIEKADFAFWHEIAKAFPEATGGDFPPDASFDWDRARDDAVFTWLFWNHPRSATVDRIQRNKS